jgi:hypothetical protein
MQGLMYGCTEDVLRRQKVLNLQFFCLWFLVKGASIYFLGSYKGASKYSLSKSYNYFIAKQIIAVQNQLKHWLIADLNHLKMSIYVSFKIYLGPGSNNSYKGFFPYSDTLLIKNLPQTKITYTFKKI